MKVINSHFVPPMLVLGPGFAKGTSVVDTNKKNYNKYRIMYFYFARAQSRAFCLSCDPSKLEIIVSVREASTNDGKEDVADAPC